MSLYNIKQSFYEQINYLKVLRRIKNLGCCLCYHSVGSNSFSELKLHHVVQENFYSQLNSLKKKSITFLPIDEFLSAKSRKGTLSISFDDGYSNISDYVVPILESLNIPFTVFINSSTLTGKIPLWRDIVREIIKSKKEKEFIDFLKNESKDLAELIENKDFYWVTKSEKVNSKDLTIHLETFFTKMKLDLNCSYLSDSDIINLPKNIVTIGNHSHSHFRLSTLDKNQQYDEIMKCKNIIDRIDCEKSEYFAIPFGENATFNQDTIDLLSDLSYKGFLMTNQNQFGQTPLLEVNPRKLLFTNRILPQNESIIKI